MVTVTGEEALVPRPRSKLPVQCAAVLGLLGLVISFLLDSDQISERAGLTALCLALQTCIYSLCLFAEEACFHSKQRYHGSLSRIFQACCSGRVFLGMVVLFLMLKMGGVLISYDKLSTISLTCAFFLFSKSLGILGPAPVEISEICEVRKMIVAHGLAWSFYIGYLKFVLPDLESKVKNYTTATKIRLNSRRLHILLPLSAKAPNKPEDEDNHVAFHQNLPELQLDRAGTRKRSYKNSVYKITGQNNETFHCVLEYATPLQTLFQMSHERSAGFGERERKAQVLLFYRTLNQILENSLECRNQFRLVLIDDERTGEPHYLSREIIQHLKQQEGEIPMNPVQEQLHERIGYPDGLMRDFHGALCGDSPDEEMSSYPSLMFSHAGPLRSEPVETTDDYDQYNARR